MVERAELQETARALLETHDALRATRDSEPPSDDEGWPLDSDTWIAWKDGVSDPAYAAWLEALAAFKAACGEPVSSHPFNFRPMCEEILRG